MKLAPMTRDEAERITENARVARAGLVDRIAADPTRVFPSLRRHEPKVVTGHVYFIQAQVSRAIKIGFAVDVERRLKEIQTGNPEVLEVVGAMPGTVRAEKSLHRQFRADHIRGEWFEASAALVDYIEGNAR